MTERTCLPQAETYTKRRLKKLLRLHRPTGLPAAGWNDINAVYSTRLDRRDDIQYVLFADRGGEVVGRDQRVVVKQEYLRV